jgi:G3E family GTPase
VTSSAPLDDLLPTTVLTGFLGSGKTTLLRRALAAPDFTDTAVIVNEVGAIAIDHYLVDFVEGAVLELPGGCLCCAVREDLARTLRDLLDRRDTGAVRPFRRIVIETSGLAETGAASLARFAEAARQAALADALVISKTDLAPVSAELDAALAALNPPADRIIGRDANNPEQVLFASPRHPRAGGGPGAVAPSLALDSRIRGNDDVAASDHVHTHGIDTFAVVLSGEITRLDFAKALGRLAGAFGSDLLRVKGIVAFADRRGRPALVQAAQHTMFAPEWLDGWPDDDHRSRLVFVVHDIPRAAILAQFASASPMLIEEQASRLRAHV